MEGIMCSLPLLFVLFLRQALSLNLKLALQLGWLTRETREYASFCSPSARVTGVCLPPHLVFIFCRGPKARFMFTKQALHSLNPLQPSSLPLTSTVFTFQDCAGVDFSRETWGILRLDVTPSTMCCHGGQSKLSLRASVPWNKMGSLHGHHPKGS